MYRRLDLKREILLSKWRHYVSKVHHPYAYYNPKETKTQECDSSTSYRGRFDEHIYFQFTITPFEINRY